MLDFKGNVEEPLADCLAPTDRSQVGKEVRIDKERKENFMGVISSEQ